MFPNEKEEIDFRKFLQWELSKGGSAEEDVDDGDGLLDSEELVNLEASLNVTLTEAQAVVIISQYDPDGDGKMTLADFLFYYTTANVDHNRSRET